MGNKKSVMEPMPERPELERLYERAKTHKMTNREIRAQMISFVYGNAPQGSGITLESAEAAVDRMRLLDD